MNRSLLLQAFLFMPLRQQIFQNKRASWFISKIISTENRTVYICVFVSFFYLVCFLPFVCVLVMLLCTREADSVHFKGLKAINYL